jgi:hypothetical protein
MIRLNFPEYEFRFHEKAGKLTIFDPARKKYVALTPEEWVRQHVVQYLHREKQVPLSLIGIESEISLYKTRKRFDIAVFDRNGHPQLIVECKSPSVSISQQVLDQVVRYNMALKVGFLMLTNGFQHIYCQVDKNDNSVRIIKDIPDFAELC